MCKNIDIVIARQVHIGSFNVWLIFKLGFFPFGALCHLCRHSTESAL